MREVEFNQDRKPISIRKATEIEGGVEMGKVVVYTGIVGFLAFPFVGHFVLESLMTGVMLSLLSLIMVLLGYGIDEAQQRRKDKGRAP